MWKILLAYLRCALHGMFGLPWRHSVDDVFDSLTGRPAAVYCRCGRVFYDDMPDGRLRAFLGKRKP